MDNSFLDERDKSITYLLQQTDGFFFLQFMLLSQLFLEVTVANLLDNIVIMAAFHNVNHTDDVLWF